MHAMSQQLGAWLRARRRDRGWDVPGMARQLAKAAGGERDALPGLDSLVAYVRRWERGGCGISERYMLLYCAALGIAPGEFGDDAGWPAARSGVAAAGHQAIGYPPLTAALLTAATFMTEPPGVDGAVVPAAMGAQDGGQSAGRLTDVLKAWDELMQRRAFLRGAGVAGMLALTPHHPAEFPPGDRAGAVEACAQLTATCRRLDAVLGPGAVYGLAADHQRRLTGWLQDARSPAAWRQLAAVTADAGILLAWLSFDLDRFDEAALRYRECSGLARGLEDVNLRAFLAGRMSRTLSECGRHADALAFADAAERIAGTAASCAVRSWLAVTRGYVHSSLGADHEKSCRADLDAAASLLGKAGEEPLPPYLAFFGQPYLDKWRGHALLALAEHKVTRAAAEGRAAIDQALASWSHADVRESGEVLAAAASARLASEEIGEAARLTGRACQVAVAAGSPRIMRYVTGLRRRMDPWRDSRDVRALDEQLLAGR
jgi:transcriptional regulator with XRE-family HTH domain